MSKKDYILLADAIRDSNMADDQKELFAKHLSQYLRRDNPRFMEGRFVDYTMGRGGPGGGKVKTKTKVSPAERAGGSPPIV